MIKTVILDGTEQCITGLGGDNTVITNFGSTDVYASAYPDIIPDGRNVAAISAGSAAALCGTNGTVYLLGSGKVQLEGTDYKVVNIALPSIGGNTPTSKVMPVIDGITGYFIPETRAISEKQWRNYFEGGAPINFTGVSENGNAVHLNSNESGRYSTTEPNTVYCIFKTSNSMVQDLWRPVLSKKMTVARDRYAFDIFSVATNDSTVPVAAFASIAADILSDVNTENYVVCVCSRDSTYYTGFYVNGKYISKTNQTVPTGYYSGEYMINQCSRNGSSPGNVAPGTLDIIMCAFGVYPHTDEQIKQNSEWLMRKYLGGV